MFVSLSTLSISSIFLFRPLLPVFLWGCQCFIMTQTFSFVVGVRFSIFMGMLLQLLSISFLFFISIPDFFNCVGLNSLCPLVVYNWILPHGSYLSYSLATRVYYLNSLSSYIISHLRAPVNRARLVSVGAFFHATTRRRSTEFHLQNEHDTITYT